MKTPIDRMPWGAQLVVLALSAVTIVACERRLDSAHANANRVASSSAVLIGTPPAPPSTAGAPETTPVPPERQLTANGQAAATKPLAETPQTTSSSEGSKELTKAEESRSMPLPGQPNDHSNLASDGSQRAGQADPQSMPDRASPGTNAPQRQTATQ